MLKHIPKLHRDIASLLVSFVLILWAVTILGGLGADVDTSYRSFPADTDDPDSLLNHANTYFWWARYRKNTLPEFDSATTLARRAMARSEARLATDGDSIRYRQRMRQAREIMTAAEKRGEVCRTNISSVVPFYMEIMGHDDPYFHEDADPADVPNVALRGALAKLTGLMSPERVVPLTNRPGFVLLHVSTTNPLAEEMLTQELNNGSRFYTISDHELVKILGVERIDRGRLVTDTASLRRIAAAFRTEEVAVLDFMENDRVDGIYYYGIRLSLWSASGGWDPRNIYTEYMVRDRVFNQVTIFILPLFFAFALLAVALNLLTNVLIVRFFGMEGVHPLYMLICFTVSALIQYVLVAFVLRNFLNPDPEDYFVSDGAEAWSIAYPVTFILPIFLTYLVLGKLDNIITSFQSHLDRPMAIFAMATGSLLTIPCAMTYFQMLRFGNVEGMVIWPLLMALLLLSSLLAARHITRIINFPESVHMARRVFSWTAVACYGFLAFLLVSGMLTDSGAGVLKTWFLTIFLPTAVLLEAAGECTRWLTRPKRAGNKVVEQMMMPEGLKGVLELSEKEGGWRLFSRQDVWYASLYVTAKRGMDVSRVMMSHFSLADMGSCFVVDFSKKKQGSTEVHYYPFARAFEKELAFSKFNDVAETARKTTNILGRLISAFTSAGDVLIDERSTKPRNPRELSAILLSILGRRPCILLLDHLEEIDEENVELLKNLTEAIQRESVRTGRHTPPILAAGFGEYGYRDKVLSILEGLSTEQVRGCVEFRMQYADPASWYLERMSAPVQLKLHLAWLFRSRQRNDVPENITLTIKELRSKGRLFTDPGSGLLLASIDQLNDLPDIDHLIEDGHFPEGDAQVKEAMTAAAYIADADGRFHLNVLSHVLDIDTIRLLRILKDAEHQNLVYDLKGQEMFWRYEFTDKALISDFKRLENPRQERASQLAYEYIRRFVTYHCPAETPAENARDLREAFRNGQRDIASLMLLAERAHLVQPAFPGLAFHLNDLVATLISSHAVSHFDQALTCCKNCRESALLLRGREREGLEARLQALRLIEFRLLLETGKHHDTSIKGLMEELSQACDSHAIDDARARAFRFLRVRYHFTSFSEEDQRLGPERLAAIRQESLSEAEEIRAIFYGIKLEPSWNLHFRDAAAMALMRDVQGRYEGILGRLEQLYLTDPQTRGLYREVLNDYAGSFLSDKVLSLTGVDAAAPSRTFLPGFLHAIGLETPELLFSRIRALLIRRLSLERETDAGVEPFGKSRLSELLADRSGDIDRRGLCYTLNYMSRAYLYTNQWELCLDVSEMSYRFNRELGDGTGEVISAGVAGRACESLGRKVEAFLWYERSFGHGWKIKHYSRAEMVLNLCRLAQASGDPQALRLAAFYSNQLEWAFISQHVSREAIDEEFAHLLLSSTEGVRKQEPKGLPGVPQEWLSEGSRLLEGLYDLAHRYRMTDSDSGDRGLPEGVILPGWRLHFTDLNGQLSPGLEGVEMKLYAEAVEEEVLCRFYKVGLLEWRLLHLEVKKRPSHRNP